MKSRKKLSIFILTLTILFQVSLAHAYVIDSLPLFWTQNWHPHVTLSSLENTAATNAASTWNSAPGNLKFSKQTQSSGTIDLSDTRNDVAALNFSQYEFLPNNFIGAIYRQPLNGTTHRNFDIFLNRDYNWGDGSSPDYFDRQGVFTHEFGHALGLGDVYVMSTPVPTMYYDGTYFSYAMRTLENDDRSGKLEIENRLNNK
ncbi:MAG: matrixin family metalloprotease [Bacillota bacterium]|nr:matrixin family metalloprotease [Bacillota bacterium]